MMPPLAKAAPKPRVQRRVPAVSRAIAILRCLAETREPIGVVALSREVNLIPSTCLHIVRILVDEGLISFHPPTKGYALGAGIMSLASAFAMRNPFVQIVRMRLDVLARQHGCAFVAMEESGPDHYVIVAVADVQTGLSIRMNVGTRFPVFSSAPGRCWAAFRHMTAAELKKSFARLKWDNAPVMETWLNDVREAQKRGYALDIGDFLLGVSTVAVPVFNNSGAMLGCIAAVGLREQFVDAKLSEIIASVRAVAREVNTEFGNDAAFDPRHPNPAPTTPRRTKKKSV